MKDLEFFRDISIGQYVDTGSRLHAFAPGTKYLGLFALAGVALAAPSPLGVLLPFIVAFGLARAAHVGQSFLLRGLRMALPFFVILVVFQFLFSWSADGSPLLFALGPFRITLRVLWTGLLLVVRGAAMIAVVSLFTSVTSESEILEGVETGLRPFGKLGLPVHLLSLAIGSAVRFVPIIAGELESIVKAQACRGADFGSERKGPIARARAWLPLFVPVTIRALERAELLAEAMEARCYTGVGRVSNPVRKVPSGERVARALFVLAMAGWFALDVLIINGRIRPW